ncbi:MAG: hypothetical protein A2655_03470 [Candidatus Yanofskybacteria bacterium RIFCSPHIGHO2_01_FULL_43_42]|uniref:Uncharacterized protein n=1 Tax=Candidatus Yanofskybacteria bacterium RIFCSPLOWO2_01_FULL_43_22 TaxID=1802695 RepID=A0A1F8GJ22_9BACT|nr:MAG: hypothetical protein A2655_03470 [Candidatus Yanofskybacteria bacterium RIFCSPHIGHO2_01_FULL_43_42]OGN13864.1 MAG: hypothetical protein A3D48_02150 [Candidatus Yanofskybacteria bacterium RIFCSPHIGHO2_02_FULL_43_17]OGN25392.1 MAG: hypothetical protein A3A13_03365 [Candidatus Yanofskybacteria bacterium RIFCSPLOWO2_01_FULL_43_22]
MDLETCDRRQATSLKNKLVSCLLILAANFYIHLGQSPHLQSDWWVHIILPPSVLPLIPNLQHPQNIETLAIKAKTTTDQPQYKASKPQKALDPQLDQKNKTPATQTKTINTLLAQ